MPCGNLVEFQSVPPLLVRAIAPASSKSTPELTPAHVIKEEDIIRAAFVTVEIEGMKRPMHSAIDSCALETLEDRVLSR